MKKKMLTMKEACEVLGIATCTLRDWDKKGLIKTIRTLGNQRRISVEEVERILTNKKK